VFSLLFHFVAISNDAHQVYKTEDVLKVKLDVLQKTSMIDFIIRNHKNATNSDEVPQGT
jgi:hypothetical protein